MHYNMKSFIFKELFEWVYFEENAYKISQELLFFTFSTQVSERQIELLLKSLEDKRSEYGDDWTSKKDKNFWEKMSDELNNEGPCVKCSYDWLRVCWHIN